MQKFIDRVNAERSALRIVNTSCGHPQLCGLTRAAIAEWESADKAASSRVAEELLGIARLTCSLSERSGGLFDDRELADSKEIEQALAALHSYLFEDAEDPPRS